MKLTKRIGLLVFLCSMIIMQNGQGQNITSISLEQAYESVEKTYGADAVLINGKYFEDVYRNDLGHPYYREDAYVPGYLIIRGKRIDTLRLKYNIYNQTLVISSYSGENASPAFVPPNEFVSEFAVHEESFKRVIFQNGKSGFYHELFDGPELSCLYGYSKRKDESYHNKTFLAYRFSQAQKKYYLVQDGYASVFRSNRSFIRALNQKSRKEISAYLKEHKIKLKRSDTREMEALGAFCNKVLMESK